MGSVASTSTTPKDVQESSGVKVKDGRLLRARAPDGNGPLEPKNLKTYVIPVVAGPRLSLGLKLAEGCYQVFERLFAIVALVVSAPILLLEAIAIRADSRGPVLFRHKRAGKSVPVLGRDILQRTDLQAPDGEIRADEWYWVPNEFQFVKLRTMYQDALQRFPELYWWNYHIREEEFQDYYHNLDDDPRVTRVGKFLRKTSLDELVNFWHVLTGECRLVGPRPEIPDILPYYTAEEMRKFTIKPGLTCLWAIQGRGELSVRQKNELDLHYVENRTILLDLRILVLTIWCVISRRGAF